MVGTEGGVRRRGRPVARRRQREFTEELGVTAAHRPADRPRPGAAGGKARWSRRSRCAGTSIAATAVSNTFSVELPKGSGRFVEFPEIDRVAWVSVAVARTKLLNGQRPLLDQLMAAPELAGYGEGHPDGRARAQRSSVSRSPASGPRHAGEQITRVALRVGQQRIAVLHSTVGHLARC